MSTELLHNSTESLTLVHVNTANRISARELHKYVMGLIAIFMLFIITYPIAIHRVAQKQKFTAYKSHLKSLTAQYKSIEP